MTIQQIQYILEVHRSGSISKAAANLYLTQPNLSSAIRSLEQELGFPVFVRSNKGISLTEQGLLVLEEAGQIQESYERMLRAALRSRAVRCRIGGITYVPVCEAYTRLCTEYQNLEQVDFSYHTYSFHDALEKMYLSMLDAAVSAIWPLDWSDAEKMAEKRGLKMEKFRRVPIVLRIGPEHPLYHEPEIKLSDFQNYTCVGYTEEPFLHSEELRALLKINLDRAVMVDDRIIKSRLVSVSKMYCIGCQLPPRINCLFRFRTIPLGDIHIFIVTLLRKKQKPTREVLRYLELLQEELESL